MVKRYDLGNVRGQKGEDSTGDMASNIYDPRGIQKDIYLAAASTTRTVQLLSTLWDTDDGDTHGHIVVPCEGITSANNFEVGLAYSSDESAAEAWEKARPRIISQTENQFTILARGVIPDVNIFLSVVIFP